MINLHSKVYEIYTPLRIIIDCTNYFEIILFIWYKASTPKTIMFSSVQHFFREDKSSTKVFGHIWAISGHFILFRLAGRDSVCLSSLPPSPLPRFNIRLNILCIQCHWKNFPCMKDIFCRCSSNNSRQGGMK